MWGKLDLPFIAGCGNGRRKPWVKDVGGSPEAEKKNEMDSHSLGEWDSPKSYGRNAFLLTSWYYSRRIILDFSPTELLDKTSVSFSATIFVVICYSSLKKKKKNETPMRILFHTASHPSNSFTWLITILFIQYKVETLSFFFLNIKVPSHLLLLSQLSLCS